MRLDGSFVAPLALVAGTLDLTFDELEILKATVTTVTPFTGGDKGLKDVVDSVNDLLQTPWLAGSTSVADDPPERGILPGQTGLAPGLPRGPHRATLAGAAPLSTKDDVRSHLPPRPATQAGASEPIPVYLPEGLARDLPLYQRFPARLLAEVHLQQDQFEIHPSALKAPAVARVAPFAGPRS